MVRIVFPRGRFGFKMALSYHYLPAGSRRRVGLGCDHFDRRRQRPALSMTAAGAQPCQSDIGG